MLAVMVAFERDGIREWIKAGMTDARQCGKAHGRPRATANNAAQMWHWHRKGSVKR
jgi:DNA invertase Pin-like site-specific DNA recombinase